MEVGCRSPGWSGSHEIKKAAWVGVRRLLCQNRERGENGRGVRSDAKWRVKKGGVSSRA
jgi:hypothetical protein